LFVVGDWKAIDFHTYYRVGRKDFKKSEYKLASYKDITGGTYIANGEKEFHEDARKLKMPDSKASYVIGAVKSSTEVLLKVKQVSYSLLIGYQEFILKKCPEQNNGQCYKVPDTNFHIDLKTVRAQGGPAERDASVSETMFAQVVRHHCGKQFAKSPLANNCFATFQPAEYTQEVSLAFTCFTLGSFLWNHGGNAEKHFNHISSVTDAVFHRNLYEEKTWPSQTENQVMWEPANEKGMCEHLSSPFKGSNEALKPPKEEGNPLPGTLLAIAIVILAIGAGIGFYFWQQKRQQTSSAPLPPAQPHVDFGLDAPRNWNA